MRRLGYRLALIGTALMGSDDPRVAGAAGERAELWQLQQQLRLQQADR